MLRFDPTLSGRDNKLSFVQCSVAMCKPAQVWDPGELWLFNAVWC
jgi:hypothetical protein